MQILDNSHYPRAALRVKEACASLSISRSKLYEEVAAGRSRHLRPALVP
jgi:hypothetical protein